jgi:hypothetical protein
MSASDSEWRNGGESYNGSTLNDGETDAAGGGGLGEDGPEIAVSLSLLSLISCVALGHVYFAQQQEARNDGSFSTRCHVFTTQQFRKDCGGIICGCHDDEPCKRQ